MQILSVHINRFGPLSDYNMDFASGINLIEGGNEAGKSTLAAFIKFIFYGLSSKSDADDLSERQRYPAWNSSGASGSMILLHKEIKYRVHREFIVGAKGNKSENVIITKADSGEVVAGTPDKLFLGVTEEIFRRSCYIGQTDGSRISGACLNEAIENILFSADEAVNTQRALKRLDEARTMLLHKNQKGGKIFEIRREQDVLLDELNEAKATMAILAERREKAYESKRIVDDKKAKFAAVDAKIKYTEATRRMKNIENIQQLKAKLGEIEEQLSQENGGFSPDRGYYETLCYMGDEYRTAEQEAARLHAEAEVLREKVQGVNPESDNTSDLLNQVEKAKSRGRISVFAGIILALLGAVIFAVFYFELINADVAPYGAATAGAGAMLVFAAVSFINAMLYKRKVRKIFSDNGVSDQKELSALIEGIAHMRAELRSMEEKLAQLEGGHTEQIRLQEEKLDAINAHLLKCGKMVHDTQGLEAAQLLVRDMVDTYAAKTAEVEKYRGIISAGATEYTMQEEKELRAIIEAGSPEQELSPEEYDNAKRDRNFLLQTSESLQVKYHENEKQLAELSARITAPSEIAAKLDSLRTQERRLTECHAAYVLAHEQLSQAAVDLRSKIAPRLSQAASGFMQGATGGKYDTIGVDGKMPLRYADVEGVPRELGFLSAGTQDLAYISLRMALLELLFSGNSAPLIFDESFARQDDTRLRAIFSVLYEYGARGNQVIILTSQQRERELLAGLGEMKFVQM